MQITVSPLMYNTDLNTNLQILAHYKQEQKTKAYRTSSHIQTLHKPTHIEF